MYRVLRPVLFLLPAELAHWLGLLGLRIVSASAVLCRWMRRRALGRALGLQIDVAGMRFEHPIALAAGLDKNAEAVAGLFGLGFSAIEVGSITPRGQPGNPKPRLFRIPAFRAVINRMGMNNRGANAAKVRLARLRFRPGIVGISVGKNADTPLERAVQDYAQAAQTLLLEGDYVAVNASSPNTPGLRTLQAPEQLDALLKGVQAVLTSVSPPKPLFLKFAPDLSGEAIDSVVDVAVANGVAGLIATNTTLERPMDHPVAKEAGGLSGEPLRAMSTAAIRRAYQRAAGRLAIIGVGGIFTARDAYEKIRAGASVVQVYTGFIYEGPSMVKQMVRELAALLHEDGFTSVAQAVGRDAR